MDYPTIFFILANLTITAGYFFVGFKLAPVIKVTYWYTKVGGAFFFFLCGLTHLDMAYHAWSGGHHELITWYSLLIHIPQAVAVWMFVLGLYKEFVLDADRTSAKDVPPKDPS